MFRNYLITAWRNIIKNGIFSVINIFGLAIGLMSCILIMLFVEQETGFDSWLTDKDRLVRMHTAYSMPNQEPFNTVRSAGSMMEAIRDFAKNEIEDGVRFIQFNMTIQQDGHAFSEQITMVDGSFFNIFDLPFAFGAKASSFNKPMDLVISEKLAHKYFGRTNVVGETLTVCCIAGKTATLPITGVIKTLPDATHLNTNILVYLQPSLFAENDGTLNTWTSLNVYTYFKLNQNIKLKQLQDRINYWINNESPLVEMLPRIFGTLSTDKKVTDFLKLKLMPVPKLHLEAKRHAGNLGDLTPMGDGNMIKTFVLVAALVLLIACINFMNLSTAKASKRAREVAMRKVLGASRTQVAIQFLGEAIALVLLSLLFSLVAVELILPFYNQLIGKELTLDLFNDLPLLFTLLLISICVGIGAGLYPALYLSHFKPGHILKSSKNVESASSAKLRTLLVIFQFSISIILVISTLVVYSQTIFSNNIDVGYQHDNKLILNIARTGDNLTSLKQELLNLPEVTSLVYSSESPTQDNENNNNFKLLETHSNGVANQNIVINYHNMGYGFFEAYKVKPLAGRLFNKEYGSDSIIPIQESENKVGKASVILNESALKKFGFTHAQDAIGKTLETDEGGKQHLTIIGVIPDIYFRSIKFGVRASIYTLNPSRFRVANISFKTDNVPALMLQIENIWKRNIPMQPISFEFLNEMMKAQYHDELTTAQLFLIFSLLAIVVACLGLFGLSAFTVERRTKEIGIRKVMGASVKDIVSLLLWQFSQPVMIANMIAWPIATYMMLSWLEAFPYRIDTLWLIPMCLSVGLLSLMIAWLTVGLNASRVARKNPIYSLRYE
ncbi:ABC transporter permease [Pseudoalteromonas denitrificans]|uniref:Putative ABC transport system permease protein n=1 Tax=Pseudoalteromonas denitrificans DSM 6059 TaxID=1123010 RepID=A0A1I1QDQ8_9GAMM|nr:ABC transporter permease [Pseudoalteromonas denitrificans]SFD20147.1 putative ABC transport system permease protein [Pseudoalteromonas denitrificans DSM 6059]